MEACTLVLLMSWAIASRICVPESDAAATLGHGFRNSLLEGVRANLRTPCPEGNVL